MEEQPEEGSAHWHCLCVFVCWGKGREKERIYCRVPYKPEAPQLHRMTTFTSHPEGWLGVTLPPNKWPAVVGCSAHRSHSVLLQQVGSGVAKSAGSFKVTKEMESEFLPSHCAQVNETKLLTRKDSKKVNESIQILLILVDTGVIKSPTDRFIIMDYSTLTIPPSIVSLDMIANVTFF